MGRAAAALACALLVAAAPALAAAPLRVACTSTDLASLTEAVGGASVSVTSLAPPAGDPHAVEVKPSLVARLREADLLVRVGLDHEPWLARAVRVSGNPRIVPGASGDVDTSRRVRLLQTETPRLRADARPHVHALGNPHYWLDPENARPVTAAIVEALARARPAEAARFEANRARFLERLDAGIARWRGMLAPWRGERVVVTHDTWPYFAARFGLAIAGAIEPTPGVPPTAAELAALVARMRAARVRVVIVEPHSDVALARRVADSTGARLVALAPSVNAEPGATDYLALMDLNVKRLAAALGG